MSKGEEAQGQGDNAPPPNPVGDLIERVAEGLSRDEPTVDESMSADEHGSHLEGTC